MTRPATLPPFAAFLQLDITEPDTMLTKINSALTELEPPAGAVIVLPELWGQGINFTDLPGQCAQTATLLNSLQNLAQHHDYLLAGSLPAKDNGQTYNSLFVVDGSGIIGRYDKQHLFTPMAEPDHFQAALALQPMSNSHPFLAGLVCFDLRFPELVRQQARWGATMLLISAEWPLARIAHWRLLIQARAIENQLYVVACNRVGEQNGTVFGGHSMIVAPDGTILAEAGEEEVWHGTPLDTDQLDEVRSRFNTIGPSPYNQPDQGKILILPTLHTILERQKQINRKVVFTNGCFDILHEGHVSYLEAARRQGDLLVIGLNDDASIRSIKGPDRPMNNEASRARVLAALGCVDYVVLFGDDTPLHLITTLQPDVLIKGADWPIDQIVGAKEVLADGGQVKTIEFVGTFSTTGLIEKIRNK